MQIEATVIALKSKKFKKLNLLVDDNYNNFEELLDIITPIARDHLKEEFIVYQIDLPQFDLHFNPEFQLQYNFGTSDREMLRDAFAYLRDGSVESQLPIPSQTPLPNLPVSPVNEPAFILTPTPNISDPLFKFEQIGLTPKQLECVKHLLTVFEADDLLNELSSLVNDDIYTSRDITTMLKDMIKANI